MKIWILVIFVFCLSCLILIGVAWLSVICVSAIGAPWFVPLQHLITTSCFNNIIIVVNLFFLLLLLLIFIIIIVILNNNKSLKNPFLVDVLNSLHHHYNRFQHTRDVQCNNHCPNRQQVDILRLPFRQKNPEQEIQTWVVEGVVVFLQWKALRKLKIPSQSPSLECMDQACDHYKFGARNRIFLLFANIKSYKVNICNLLNCNLLHGNSWRSSLMYWLNYKNWN